MSSPTKQQLINEFTTMKSIEQQAHDFYTKAAADPLAAEDRISGRLREIAEDERHHIQLVDRILNTISNCL